MRLGTILRRSSLSAIAAAALLGGVVPTVVKATVVPFYFEFSDDGSSATTGTLTGVIYGLDDNTANQKPTSIQITSAPAGMFNDTPLSLPTPTAPLTITPDYYTGITLHSDPNWQVDNGADSFTTVNGAITDASFLAQTWPNIGSGNGYFSLNANESSVNELSFDYVDAYYANDQYDDPNTLYNFEGLSTDPTAPGVQFSESPFPTTSTPEPASFALIGLGSVLAIRRQRRSK